MGSILTTALFPAPSPPTYSYTSMPSPPLHSINGVPCLWFRSRQQRGIILYLHCNSVDLGMIRKIMFVIARDTSFSVMAIEYPGYGVYTGTPTPDGCLRAARTVLAFIRQQSPGVPVILVGRSVGTGVAVQLAAQCQHTLAGLVLISPFRSVAHVLEPVARPLKTLVDDIFPSERTLARITTPTLIVHGARDTLVPPAHGQALFNISPAAHKHLVLLPESGHADLDWTAIVRAINVFFAHLKHHT